MPRLFVAIDLPADAKAELARIQPAPQPGLRNAKAGQMHLTLHFIGDAEIGPTAEALSGVVSRPFSLLIAGVGRFPLEGSAKVLWAGVPANAELLGLHAAVGTALSHAGFHPESRPFAPHLTLARCELQIPGSAIEDFLTRQDGFSLAPIPVREFVLFSSILGTDGPVYQREQSFRL